MSFFSLKSASAEDADDPLYGLRAEASAYGLGFVGTFDEGFNPFTDSPALPEQVQEITYELIAKHYPKVVEAVNAKRRARGQKPVGDAAKMAKWQANFEKAYYGKLRHSEKGRWAVDYLKALRGFKIVEEHGQAPVLDIQRISLAGPFMHAVHTLDVEFLEMLAQAAVMLDRRMQSSKGKDMVLDAWLLTYGIRMGGKRMHTARELNEQFVSKFRAISDHELRKKCRTLGVPLKADVRGAAAVRYRAK